MYVRGITILPREDSVMEKGLKKLIKGPCPLKDMATAWELSIKYFQYDQRSLRLSAFTVFGHLSAVATGVCLFVVVEEELRLFATGWLDRRSATR